MKWISVEDRMPSVDDCVLAYAEDEGKLFIGKIHDKQWVDTGITCHPASDCFPYTDHQDSVTHWMPLPEPPVDKS